MAENTPGQSAKSAHQPTKSRRANPRAAILLFLFWALFFKSTLAIVLAGLLAWLSYLVFIKRNRRIIALLISCAISYTAFEYIGGMILARRLAREFGSDIDHRMVPHSFPGINSDGLRCDFEAEDFSDDTFNIIFLGDSFTYGYGIDSGADAFPGQIETMLAATQPEPRVRAINFGWMTSSPLLSRRLLRDLGHKYHPDLVILNLDLTDFHDDESYGRRFEGLYISPTVYLFRKFRKDHWLVNIKETSRLPEIWRMLFPGAAPPEYIIVNRPLEESRPHLQLTEANIRAIADYCRQDLQCGFLLILLPRNIQYSARECPGNWERYKYLEFGEYVDEPIRWLSEYAATVDFPCYSLLADFKRSNVFPICFEDDPHWNRDGHGVAAEAILRRLREHGYVK
ncbi:MAG: SGNH/GDSL hydrolase family protein [Planctomycetota bacterium]